MFSGIVETKSRILELVPASQGYQIIIERPFTFDDIEVGDSICLNGVCLTVEQVTPETLMFFVGPETLRLTQFAQLEKDQTLPVNVERSLRFGDRVHGHLISGHVDSMGEVIDLRKMGESLFVRVQLPPNLLSYIWAKGSVSIHGVSLTINTVEKNVIELCLIPETLRRTNLGLLKKGDRVNIEVDMMARGFIRSKELERELNH